LSALAIRSLTSRCAGHNFAGRAALTTPLLETVMTKIPALHPTIRAWLLEGPLAAHVSAYVARLSRGD